jgi:hypothetical protein
LVEHEGNEDKGHRPKSFFGWETRLKMEKATEMGAIMPCRPIQTEIRKKNLRRMVVVAAKF